MIGWERDTTGNDVIRERKTMATQREVDAGLEVLNKLIEEHVPTMFQSQLTEDMRFNLVLDILNAAARVRKK